MAYQINGIFYSYDYTGLIKEIKNEIEEGLLNNSDIIYIIRGEKRKLCNYKPIIDYYTKMDIESMYDEPEEYLCKEDYSNEEWTSLLKERADVIEQYEKDKNNLETVTVLAIIMEMEQWNSVD